MFCTQCCCIMCLLCSASLGFTFSSAMSCSVLFTLMDVSMQLSVVIFVSLQVSVGLSPAFCVQTCVQTQRECYQKMCQTFIFSLFSHWTPSVSSSFGDSSPVRQGRVGGPVEFLLGSSSSQAMMWPPSVRCSYN